ncbi:MAG: zinc ribbon domain-containing protein [Candidatus Helarchaeota archaeon]
MLNVPMLIIFSLISGISLITMTYLLIEEGDQYDMVLIPVCLFFCIFGVVGIITIVLGLTSPLIWIISGTLSAATFFITLFGFKSINTKPDDINRFINKKAIVEIGIDANSTGRIKIIDDDENQAFPAKSNMKILKNEIVKIIRFINTVAIVKPLENKKNKRRSENLEFIVCSNCKATIEIGSKICPYCGEKL